MESLLMRVFRTLAVTGAFRKCTTGTTKTCKRDDPYATQLESSGTIFVALGLPETK